MRLKIFKECREYYGVVGRIRGDQARLSGVLSEVGGLITNDALIRDAQYGWEVAGSRFATPPRRGMAKLVEC